MRITPKGKEDIVLAEVTGNGKMYVSAKENFLNEYNKAMDNGWGFAVSMKYDYLPNDELTLIPPMNLPYRLDYYKKQFDNEMMMMNHNVQVVSYKALEHMPVEI